MAPSAGYKKLSKSQKSAAVALRVSASMEWKDIAAELEVDKAAVCRAVNKVLNVSEDKRNLNRLLRSKELDPKPAGGPPRRVKPGDATSVAVREAVLTTYEHHDQTDAANFVLEEQYKKRKALGEITGNKPKKLHAPQVYHILRDKAHYNADPDPKRRKPILRKRELNKKHLDLGDETARINWWKLAHKLQKEKAILICVDETKINCGGTPNRHVSALQEQDKFGSRSEPCFSIMQWACACGDDVGVTRPQTEWVAESSEQREELKDKLEASIQKAKEEFAAKIELAKQPGTQEFEALQAENQRRNKENAYRNSTQQKGGRLPQMTAERLFKYEPFIREATKGMDYVFYAHEIYEKLLFPYFVKIQKRNPDLEKLHSVQKKILRPYLFSITSSAKSVKEEAKARIRHVWCNNAEFERNVVKLATVKEYNL
ncbi:hypothetical protein LTR60_000432 [Cryomyces antarcticus]|nr:hypothetical protein LTR60_000432 [Cryomyces antarcticus]